jgi:hypothetical protein
VLSQQVERVHDFWPLLFQIWRQCEHCCKSVTNWSRLVQNADMTPRNSGPFVADMWRADKRGRSLGLMQLAPLLGAAVGPIQLRTRLLSTSVGLAFSGSCWCSTVHFSFFIPFSYRNRTRRCSLQRRRRPSGDTPEMTFTSRSILLCQRSFGPASCGL